MNKFTAKSKRQRTEEVNELVSWYKQQRSITNKTESSSSSTCDNLSSLNLTPWDYNLDANIVIKTEKDLALDTKDFGLNLEPELPGLSLPPKEYFEWLKMQSIHTGNKNSVSFASMKTDASSYEEQYLSLKIFMAACNTVYKRELSGILYPIFVHFYLDLIVKPDYTTAQSFFNKFNHDHDEQQKELLQNLPKITSYNQLKIYLNIKEFREHKISLKLSPHVYLYLLQHLRHGNYTLVLQTLNRRFSIKTSNVMSTNKTLEEVETLEDEFDFFDEYGIPWSSSEQQAIDNLQKSIAEINNSSKILKPSICLYSYINAYHGLSCSSFSNNATIIAGGFEDSSVRLWNLTVKNKIELKQLEDENNLDITANKECQILRGHSGTVYQVDFLPDDNFILTASQDKSVRIWNVHNKQSLVEYKGHDYSVFDVKSSSNGTYFVSASLDKTLRLWNSEYAYPLRIFAGHNDSVDCVAFHPNGNYIASGSSDKTCRLWDTQTGQFVRVFVGHKAPIYSLTFSHDGKYLISAGDDTNILVWDLSNGQLLNEVRSHSKTIYSLALSCDGSVLASGGLDSTIKVWESELLLRKSTNSLFKASHEGIGSYTANSTNIVNLKFSNGNLLLAAGMTDGK